MFKCTEISRDNLQSLNVPQLQLYFNWNIDCRFISAIFTEILRLHDAQCANYYYIMIVFLNHLDLVITFFVAFASSWMDLFRLI